MFVRDKDTPDLEETASLEAGQEEEASRTENFFLLLILLVRLLCLHPYHCRDIQGW